MNFPFHFFPSRCGSVACQEYLLPDVLSRYYFSSFVLCVFYSDFPVYVFAPLLFSSFHFFVLGFSSYTCCHGFCFFLSYFCFIFFFFSLLFYGWIHGNFWHWWRYVCFPTSFVLFSVLVSLYCPSPRNRDFLNTREGKFVLFPCPRASFLFSYFLLFFPAFFPFSNGDMAGENFFLIKTMEYIFLLWIRHFTHIHVHTHMHIQLSSAICFPLFFSLSCYESWTEFFLLLAKQYLLFSALLLFFFLFSFF